MKYLLVALLAISPWNDLDRIATINAIKKEAQIAYTNGNYEKALTKYKYLVDSLEVKDDNVFLNLANAYYKINDTTNAVDNYQALVDSKNKLVRSVAQQQLGVMATKHKKFDQALQHFKGALKADPANEDARYNYELLKKALKEQEQQEKKDQQKNPDNKEQKDKKQQDKEQQQKQQNEEQQQKEQQQKEQKQDQQQQDQSKEGEGKEQEQKDKQKADEKPGEEQKKQEPQNGEESDKENKNKQDQMSSLSDKLKEMKISEDKAKMILQALRNKEIQYYQQNKRKATKPNDSDKPDW